MKRSIYLVCLALLMTLSAVSQSIPEPMKPASLVNDFAGLFTESERLQLESNLVAFERKSSTQIAVVTILTLDDDAISSYAVKLFNKWGIGGNSEKNNGVLILIKPKTNQEPRNEVFISIGYGLEGAIPDILAGRIVDYDLIPSFKTGNYFEGVSKAVGTIESLASGEFTAEQYIKSHGGKGALTPIITIAMLVIFGLMSAFSNTRKNRGDTVSSGSDGRALSSGILLASILLGGRGGGGFGGFSGGSGGFGGFGGGSSGGGGAGGSW